MKIRQARPGQYGTKLARPGQYGTGPSPDFYQDDFEGNLSLKANLTHYFHIKQGIKIKIYIITSTEGCLLDLQAIREAAKKRGFFVARPLRGEGGKGFATPALKL